MVEEHWITVLELPSEFRVLYLATYISLPPLQIQPHFPLASLKNKFYIIIPSCRGAFGQDVLAFKIDLGKNFTYSELLKILARAHTHTHTHICTYVHTKNKIYRTL